MIGIDTNILVRYFAKDDLFQLKKSALLLEQRLTVSDPGYISLVTLIELIWVMEYSWKRSKDEIIYLVEHLLVANNLVLQNELQVAVALDKFKQGQNDFADALIGALGIAAGCSKTLTFDRKASRFADFDLL